MKEKCVILISHMFENVTGGAGTYANYLYDSLALNNSNIFDFYLLTHDISHPRKNIISVKVDNEKDSSFYKKMKKYRSVLDDFIMHSGLLSSLILIPTSQLFGRDLPKKLPKVHTQDLL